MIGGQMREDEMPEISEQEWRDLEAEAGHPLMSKRACFEFRMRKLYSEAVDNMLVERKK